MAENGPMPMQPSKEAVQTLRTVFEWVRPVDRQPVYRGLVRAIDEFDREQRRRREDYDAPKNQNNAGES